MVMTRSMIKQQSRVVEQPRAAEQVKQEESIIRTRSQKLRESMVYHRSVLNEINAFFTANQREPTEGEERYLALYIQRMREYKATGALRPEFIMAVDDTIPWFVWAEAKETSATVSAPVATAQPHKVRYMSLMECATLMLFLYSLGRFVNSVYSPQMSWASTLTPGAWGLYSWGLWA